MKINPEIDKKLSILKYIYGWNEHVQYKTIEERYSDLAEGTGILSESKALI